MPSIYEPSARFLPASQQCSLPYTVAPPTNAADLLQLAAFYSISAGKFSQSLHSAAFLIVIPQLLPLLDNSGVVA